MFVRGYGDGLKIEPLHVRLTPAKHLKCAIVELDETMLILAKCLLFQLS